MHAREQALRDFLFGTGLVSRSALAFLDERVENGEKLSQALVASGLMTENDVRQATAKSLGLPYVELQPHEIDHAALMELPEPLCRAHGAFAYRKDGRTLEIALTDLDALDALRMLRLPWELKGRLTDARTLKRALVAYQALLRERHAEGIAAHARLVVPPLSHAEEDIRYSAERLPVEQLLDALLEYAIVQRAETIHLEQRKTDLSVRYRIGGVLYDAMLLPAAAADAVIARLKLLAKLPLAARGPHEGRFKLVRSVSPDAWSVRVSTVPTLQGEKAVLRLFSERTARSGFSLEALGFHGKGADIIERCLKQESGMLLVAGPRTSGRSTLMYSLLDLCTDPSRSVATVEESAELLLPGIVQTIVEPGVSFASSLRSALRMDPDVLMVERLAPGVLAPLIEAANSSALVITATEAESAAGALEELAAAGVPRERLGAIIHACIETRLVRALCPKHAMRKLSREELTQLEARGANMPLVLETLKEEGAIEPHLQWKDVQFGAPEPCEACEDGYAGLVGIQEVVPMTRSLARALEEGNTEGDIAAARPLSLLEDALYKAARGRTSIDEVLELSL